MSTNTTYSLEDVLDPKELQKLGSPDEIREEPDAQVVEWDEALAVTTPGNSIASSMDRFKAGNLTPAQFRTLEGFYSEFTDNGERVVFVEHDVKELLGDQAMVMTQEFDEAYAVAVRTPEDAMDVIREYDQHYAGNVEQQFREEIDARHAVMPVIYNGDGVITETGVSLMGGNGVLTSDDSPSVNELLEKDVSEMEAEGLNMDTYPAPERAEADQYIDIRLPPGYDEATHHATNNSLIMEVDGEKQMKALTPGQEVIGYEENNGVYTIQIGE